MVERSNMEMKSVLVEEYVPRAFPISQKEAALAVPDTKPRDLASEREVWLSEVCRLPRIEAHPTRMILVQARTKQEGWFERSERILAKVASQLNAHSNVVYERRMFLSAQGIA